MSKNAPFILAMSKKIHSLYLEKYKSEVFKKINFCCKCKLEINECYNEVFKTKFYLYLGELPSDACPNMTNWKLR